MLHPISFGKFSAAWLSALTVTSVADPAPRLADAYVIPMGGVAVPLATCALGALGVALARPLARRQENTLPLPLFLVVSAIMLLTVEIWIIDSRPPALFAFVIAIGLGFSGFSLIELVGNQVREFAARLITSFTNKDRTP
ncbi:hypothetical protein [Novosphingobium sp.]|uniref:hypothetical protein n=1 Tax=Novosphingobium sp. TaxID=1874826 RepID=UPI0026242081|nr:hypothetical protein [Novosphingobium sp.]